VDLLEDSDADGLLRLGGPHPVANFFNQTNHNQFQVHTKILHFDATIMSKYFVHYYRGTFCTVVLSKKLSTIQ
jgi:hypothetical protein